MILRPSCACLAALLGAALALAQPAGPDPVSRVASPEIGPDRRVTFRLLAPKASEVTVSGEFMSGSVPLAKDAAGLWSVTVGPVDPEIYYYNFAIDGVRTLDPANPGVKTGSTAGTIQSVLEVRGAAPAFYDGRPVPHGEIPDPLVRLEIAGRPAAADDLRAAGL